MKIAKYFCFAIGTTLLIAALFLILHNVKEDKQGGERARSVISELKEEIPEYVPVTTMSTTEDDFYEELSENNVIPEMPLLEIDGNMYVGYIEIPDIEIELPVMSEWSYEGLKISPCRYKGNVYADNMVIAAHNYKSHFGSIKELQIGAEIKFTDVSGKITVYSVTDIEQLSGTAIEQMEFGAADEWDITLFTCTIGGQSRVTVRAVRTEE